MQLQQLQPVPTLLIIAFLTVCLWSISQINKKTAEFQKQKISLMRNYKFSWQIFRAKNILLTISIIFIALALLQPQWGERKKTLKTEGIDIVFSLDLSQSMKAKDIPVKTGRTDRLSIAKTTIENYINANPQNRYSMVIFAGEAFVSVPLTTDHQAFLTFLQATKTEDIVNQGTNLSQAIEKSIKRFTKEENNKKRTKVVFLISDGGEEITEEDKASAQKAKKQGIKIYTIGIGSEKGAPIEEKTNIFGETIYKTHKGKIVITKLNEQPLKKIAQITGATYHRIKTPQDILKITKDLKNLHKTTIEKNINKSSEDRYQIPLLIAFILFIAYIYPFHYNLRSIYLSQNLKST